MNRSELIDRIVALRAEGLTMSRIADEVSRLSGQPITKNTVTGIIARHAPELQKSTDNDPCPPTLWTRTQALHDEMDRVLRETRQRAHASLKEQAG